jgi:hypothetical protein
MFLVLAGIMVVGWAVFWEYLHERSQPEEPTPQASPAPASVVPDRAVEFETVSDRTPMSFRDNAAYAYLLEKARKLTPAELAGQSRRDIVLTHLWERPELYRGVSIHLLGTALRTLRFESKLSRTGWLYEAWVVTPDARRVTYCCVFEEPPLGFPLGPSVSERVVFNGYFLKIMKYEAGDVTRGAPVLVGKLGWERHAAPGAEGRAGLRLPAMSSRLFWSLVVLGAMFLISMGRWIFQFFQFGSSRRTMFIPTSHPTEDIPAEDLSAWIDSVARPAEEEWEEDPD